MVLWVAKNAQPRWTEGHRGSAGEERLETQAFRSSSRFPTIGVTVTALIDITRCRLHYIDSHTTHTMWAGGEESTAPAAPLAREGREERRQQVRRSRREKNVLSFPARSTGRHNRHRWWRRGGPWFVGAMRGHAHACGSGAQRLYVRLRTAASCWYVRPPGTFGVYQGSTIVAGYVPEETSGEKVAVRVPRSAGGWASESRSPSGVCLAR